MKVVLLSNEFLLKRKVIKNSNYPVMGMAISILIMPYESAGLQKMLEKARFSLFSIKNIHNQIEVVDVL